MESNHKLSHGSEVEAESQVQQYEYFRLQVDNQTPIQVSRHELVKLLSGANTNISMSGNNITISSTAVAGESYTHPNKAWTNKNNLSGAQVISNLTIDAKGHPTNWSVRNITPADIGAATNNHTHDFDKYVKWRLQVGTTVNDITTDELVRFVSSSSNDIILENGNITVKRKNKTVVNVSGTSVSKLTDYNNKWMNITSNNATFTVSGTFAKDDEIEGSFTGTGRLTINGSGITLIYPSEFHQNKIPQGGAFALKFISPTSAILFGRLIPVGL